MSEDWQEKTLNPKEVDDVLEQSGGSRHPQDARLKQEVEAWRLKYQQIFDEQCKVRSLETQLRERMHDLEFRLEDQVMKNKELKIKIHTIIEMLDKNVSSAVDSITELTD